MNGLARSLVEYIFSRNNDINGYWGIGMLCAMAKAKGIHRYSFKVKPGQTIKIYGCEISESKCITEKIARLDLDSIECRMSFFEDGRFENGKDKYTCGLAVSVTQAGRTGLYMSYISCWPHDPSIERKRVGKYIEESGNDGILRRIFKMFKFA